jgi:hypothetical protein
MPVCRSSGPGAQVPMHRPAVCASGAISGGGSIADVSAARPSFVAPWIHRHACVLRDFSERIDKSRGPLRASDIHADGVDTLGTLGHCYFGR